MLELKKAEKDFQLQMKQFEIDIYSLETQDTQHAREKFSNDWTPKFLGSLTLVGFIGYIFMITAYPIDDSSDDIVMLILGYLSGIASAVISFTSDQVTRKKMSEWKNFKLDEFKCKHCGKNEINHKLVDKLQTLRDDLGFP